MRPAQRVDSHVAMRLQQTYSDCLGIEKIESQLYCFYPTSIRVYEHFPQKTMPYISEELIISQGKITQFAVSNQLIALLLDDCKLIVRLRKCWQRVVYDSTINQQATKINDLKIIQNKLLYCTINKQNNSYTYTFIKINPKTKQIFSLIQTQRWKTFNKFEQFIYLKKLGNIQNFYLGLIDNQIRFGTYYKMDNTENLEQFQFGKIKQENQLNKVHSFCLVSLVKNNCQEVQNYKNNKVNQKILYLIKILQEPQSGGQNKLVIKYRKFYQEESIAEDGEDNTNVKKSQDDKQVQAYIQMMNVLYQINCVKIPQEKQKQKINDQENITKQNSNGKPNVGKISKTVHIILRKNQVYANYTQDNDAIYIATNYRLFKFIVSEKQSYIQQILQFSKNSKLVQVCQNKIYLANYQLCVLPENQLKGMKEINSQENQQSSGSYQVLNQIKEIDKQIQLSDKSEEKKSYHDSYSQTQIDSEMIIYDKMQPKKEGQLKQIKSHNEISIGQNLPMCPDSHEQVLQKINKNLLEIQNNFHKDSMKKIQQLVRKQQDRIKIEINKRLEQLIGTTIAKLIAPLVQKNIQQVIQTKLQQVNGYMYSLSMQNLLLLKQEAQRNQAKENMLRTQLFKSELHQVSESKKAVAQMVEICKKRQIQKLLFFEEVKKKFIQIQKKVIILEDKMRTLVENQQVSQAKIFDQIQIIKIMLKNKEPIIQANRKKSIMMQQKDIKNQQDQKEKQQNSSQDQNSQSQQDQSQQEQQSSLLSSEVEKNKIITKKTHTKGLNQPQKLNIYQFPPYSHPTNYPPPYRPPSYQPNIPHYDHQFPPQYHHKPQYPYPQYYQYPPLPKYVSETPEYYPRIYPQHLSQKYKYPTHYFKQAYNQDQIQIDSEQASSQKEQKRQKKPRKKEKSKNH